MAANKPEIPESVQLARIELQKKRVEAEEAKHRMSLEAKSRDRLILATMVCVLTWVVLHFAAQILDKPPWIQALLAVLGLATPVGGFALATRGRIILEARRREAERPGSKWGDPAPKVDPVSEEQS